MVIPHFGSFLLWTYHIIVNYLTEREREKREKGRKEKREREEKTLREERRVHAGNNNNGDRFDFFERGKLLFYPR